MSRKKCEYCQTEFEPLRKTSQYCSVSCKQSAYRQRLEQEDEDDEDDYDEEDYDEYEEEDEDEDDYDDDEEEEDEEEPTDNYPTLVNKGSNQLPSNQKASGKEMSERDARQMQVSGIFMQYVIHLRNINERKVKREIFEKILGAFEDLKEQYENNGIREYAMYPFTSELEMIIAEMDSFANELEDDDEYVEYNFADSSSDDWLYELEDRLRTFKAEILKRYK